jgi:hypothetical protein
MGPRVHALPRRGDGVRGYQMPSDGTGEIMAVARRPR